MEMTAVGNLAWGIPCCELERVCNLQWWSTKTSHSSGVPFFGLGIFKGCYTLLQNHTCNELQIFQNFQVKPRNFSEVFTNHPTCVFLERTTDRQTDLVFWVLIYLANYIGLELLRISPNKICYRLCPKYTSSSCFQMICSSAIGKSLILQNRSCWRHFLYLEGRSWLNVIPSFCRQILLRADYSLIHFINYPKRLMWNYVTFGYVAKM